MTHPMKFKVTIKRKGEEPQLIESPGVPKLMPNGIIVTDMEGGDWVLPFSSFVSAHIMPVDNAGIILASHVPDRN